MATDLGTTLGLQPRMRTLLLDLPDTLRQAIDTQDLSLDLLAAPSAGIEAALIGAPHDLAALSDLLAPAGFIWLFGDGAAALAASAIEAGLAVTHHERIDGLSAVRLTAA